jgi:predicted nucleotide-binding protein with TIR-like domain
MVVRNDETLGPRDNIVFELGLFMGRLGRERTFIVRPASGPLKIPSDLVRDLGFAPTKTDAQVRALKQEQGKQQTQVDQQQELFQQQQRMIDELVKYAMSASIFRHLWVLLFSRSTNTFTITEIVGSSTTCVMRALSSRDSTGSSNSMRA